MRRLQGVMFPSILDFLSTKESFVWEIVHPHFRRCLAVIVSDGALSNHFYFAPAGGLCIVCRQPTTTTTTTTTTNNNQQQIVVQWNVFCPRRGPLHSLSTVIQQQPANNREMECFFEDPGDPAGVGQVVCFSAPAAGRHVFVRRRRVGSGISHKFDYDSSDCTHIWFD